MILNDLYSNPKYLPIAFSISIGHSYIDFIVANCEFFSFYLHGI